jgi:hypothetical protein
MRRVARLLARKNPGVEFSSGVDDSCTATIHFFGGDGGPTMWYLTLWFSVDSVACISFSRSRGDRVFPRRFNFAPFDRSGWRLVASELAEFGIDL